MRDYLKRKAQKRESFPFRPTSYRDALYSIVSRRRNVREIIFLLEQFKHIKQSLMLSNENKRKNSRSALIFNLFYSYFDFLITKKKSPESFILFFFIYRIVNRKIDFVNAKIIVLSSNVK